MLMATIYQTGISFTHPNDSEDAPETILAAMQTNECAFVAGAHNLHVGGNAAPVLNVPE